MDQVLRKQWMLAEQDQRISEAIEREQSRLRNFIRRRVSDQGEAEDVLQDVFYELVEAYRVNGTPADCVALGISQWDNVDVVLSGINLGPNLGNGIWHSGTLAAAKQAVLLGLRGIAFSTPTKDDDPRFEELRPHVENVLKLLMQESSPRLLNVNISPNARGIRWTRQSIRQYDGKMVLDEDPMGREHYWFTVVPIQEPEPNTDRWAVENGWISITPLRLDLTDDTELEKLTSIH